MLTIRLARWWRKHLPFFRIVLTDHKKPVLSGYKEVLGRFNPVKHESHLNIEKIRSYIDKWVQMSSRVAKLAYKETSDEVFKKFIVYSDSVKPSKQ